MSVIISYGTGSASKTWLKILRKVRTEGPGNYAINFKCQHRHQVGKKIHV